MRMLYNDFPAFTRDQELLISINGRKDKTALDYLEGSLMMDQGSPDNWRSSFFPSADHPKIISLITKHRIIYCLEVVKHYDDQTKNTVDKVNMITFIFLIQIKDIINIFYAEYNRVIVINLPMFFSLSFIGAATAFERFELHAWIYVRKRCPICRILE